MNAPASDTMQGLRARLFQVRALAWHLCIVLTPLVAEDAAMLAMMFS